MRALKFISFTILLSFLAGFLFSSIAFAQDNLENALAEFETDNVTATSLDIKEPTVLPGDTWYWWQTTKENVGLWFTFDKEKKVEKLQQNANRRLLEARQLAEKGTDKATDNVKKALDRYENTMNKVTTRLKENSQIKDAVLEKFDTNQLRHQQVLLELSAKLENKLTDEDLETIKEIRENQTLNWYNVEPEKIQARLEKAVENNGLGSKFKQIRNYTTLEEMGVALPEEANAQIEVAKDKVEEKLGEKLENIGPADQEKLEKYIDNIQIPTIRKQLITGELKDSQELPQAVRMQVQEMNTSYSSQMVQKFNSLSDQEKEEFLKNFDERAHPTYLKALENFEVPPSLESRLKQIRERQEQGIKAKIQNTTDPLKLRTMEQNLQNYPALRLELQEQRQKMPTPDPSTIMRQEQQNRNGQ